ncbi:MAG: type II toxin-antitoxin system VapC family toxin [Candidatus Omnitrophica bacterium]|nr:type II toxin-antitoxin system VapC family toxin [Candidatus Omnitrophota bacterium]
MILLDTHVWVWWVQKDRRLKEDVFGCLDSLQPGEIRISAISCWEVATLHNLNRVSFSTSLEEWMHKAVKSPGLLIEPLTPEIAVESANLPDPFHRDPADRIIVATARTLDCQLLTEDRKVLEYEFVRSLQPAQFSEG